MKPRLFVISVVVGAGLVFLAGLAGRSIASPLESIPACTLVSSGLAITVRCDGLTKAPAAGGVTSRYVITNTGPSTATTVHDFYTNQGNLYTSPCYSLAPNEAEVYDLADVPVPLGFEGYVIVAADQPITGTVLPVVSAYKIALPLVIKQPPSSSSPLVKGESVRFRGAWGDVPLEGRVFFSERRDELVDQTSGPVYPYGVFVVAVMDVTNTGLQSDEVGRYGSFRVRDSAGRQFDIAELEVLWAAQDEYGYDGVYEAIQPGFTRRLVFAFDVLSISEDLHLVSLSPW